jgi:hypothetical protein
MRKEKINVHCCGVNRKKNEDCGERFWGYSKSDDF